MFRKIFALAGAMVFATVAPAQAAIVGPLPFTLTNGTVADASQVMANFNKIVNDVNNNIIFPAFTQQNYYATDTGSANNIAVALSPAPTQYVPGMVVSAKIVANNTGATVVNANGLGNQNVVNLNGSALKSQQVLAGSVAQMIYDGSQFELISLTPLAIRQSAFLHTVDLITAAGAWTFTVPAGVYGVQVREWGAGGGGGNSSGSGAGGGGGSGAFGSFYLAVSPGDVLSGVLGTGGTAAVAGTASTFLQNGSSLGSLAGGAAGSGGGAGAGGVGGNASGTVWTTFSMTGQSGTTGIPASPFIGGTGGSAPQGGVGGAASGPSCGNGGNPGGGGSGGGNGAGGCPGGNGWIEMEY